MSPLCVHVCSVYLSCPTLSDLMDCSPPGFSVHGIFHARILEWVAVSFSRDPCQPRDRTCISGISSIGRQILYHCAPCFEPASNFKQVYGSTYHSMFSNFVLVFISPGLGISLKKKKNKNTNLFYLLLVYWSAPGLSCGMLDL